MSETPILYLLYNVWYGFTLLIVLLLGFSSLLVAIMKKYNLSITIDAYAHLPSLHFITPCIWFTLFQPLIFIMMYFLSLHALVINIHQFFFLFFFSRRLYFLSSGYFWFFLAYILPTPISLIIYSLDLQSPSIKKYGPFDIQFYLMSLSGLFIMSHPMSLLDLFKIIRFWNHK